MTLSKLAKIILTGKLLPQQNTVTKCSLISVLLH